MSRRTWISRAVAACALVAVGHAAGYVQNLSQISDRDRRIKILEARQVMHELHRDVARTADFDAAVESLRKTIADLNERHGRIVAELERLTDEQHERQEDADGRVDRTRDGRGDDDLDGER